jgi:hypothetical protein
MSDGWGGAVAQGNAPFKFGPAEGLDFFRPAGWQPATVRWGSDESRRLKREMRGMWLWRLIARLYPAEKRERFRRISAYALLERSGKDDHA